MTIKTQVSKKLSQPKESEERVISFSTYLRPSLQKRVKRLAVELEITTATLVEQALEDFLMARENQEH